MQCNLKHFFDGTIGDCIDDANQINQFEVNGITKPMNELHIFEKIEMQNS